MTWTPHIGQKVVCIHKGDWHCKNSRGEIWLCDMAPQNREICEIRGVDERLGKTALHLVGYDIPFNKVGFMPLAKRRKTSIASLRALLDTKHERELVED